jgi:hypothetical protein
MKLEGYRFEDDSVVMTIRDSEITKQILTLLNRRREREKRKWGGGE